MLADWQIEEYVARHGLGIEPFLPDQLQPASYDLKLGPLIRVASGRMTPLDCQAVRPGHTRLQTMPTDGYMLYQGDFILASTQEVVALPLDLSARVEGKSSLGRMGLAVHITAGFIDPGFEGEITLEIKNVGPWDVLLRPYQRIAQIAFTRMDATPRRGYGAKGHYQGQQGPVELKFRMEN